MKCPFCQSDDSKVIDKRSTPGKNATRRRRECLACAKRYTTYEYIEEMPLIVIKKDNTRVEFDRNKIRAGIMKACEKRPISMEQIEEAVSAVESKIRNKADGEVSAKEIGEEVMRVLKKLDKVAYVRFASVYRAFKDVEEFKREILDLVKKKH